MMMPRARTSNTTVININIIAGGREDEFEIGSVMEGIKGKNGFVYTQKPSCFKLILC
jgi:hypothetical protein